MHELTSVEAVFFGISILVILFVLIPMYRRIVTDMVRDRLFELRDELRGHCVANSIPLDSREYVLLRQLINYHLRFLETVNLKRIKRWDRFLKRNPELHEISSSISQSLVSSYDKDLQEFLTRIRSQANDCVAIHVVLRSPPILFASACIIVFGVVVFVVKRLTNAAGRVIQTNYKEQLSNALGIDNKHIEDASFLSSKFARAA